MKITTWGRWENQRQELQDFLLSTNIGATKKSIEDALFGPVATAMYDASIQFFRSNFSRFPRCLEQNATGKLQLREITQGSYDALLDESTLIQALTSSLGCDPDSISAGVSRFSNECKARMENALFDSMLIGDWSIEAKSDAFELLYGPDFPTRHPSLTKDLKTQDQDLVEQARRFIEEKIHNSDESIWKEGKDIALEHLNYINQVAPNIAPSDQLESKFLKEVGLSIQDHKKQVAGNNGQKAPVIPGQTIFQAKVNGKKIITEKTNMNTAESLSFTGSC